MKPLKIAHVTATFPPHWTGTGLVCFYNARELIRHGHNVHVYTVALPGAAAEEKLDGVKVHRLRPLFQIGNAPLLLGLNSIHEFDIIHLHYPFIFGSELIRLISEIRNIPYIITYHNDLLSSGFRRIIFDVYRKCFLSYVLKGASKCLVVSIDHAKYGKLAPYISKYPDMFLEMPNGVDIKKFNPLLTGTNVRQSYNLDKDAKVLLFVGVLDLAHHYRRVDLLIRAIERIQESNLYLMIVGDGDQLPYYQELTKSLGVSDKVIFLGKKAQEELPDIYAASDVVILPSYMQEAFPLVLLEGMACSKPVIASELPGVRTMVTTNNGFLVKPGDLADLSEKISLLLNDPSLCARMGNQGRALVEEKYSWPSVVQRLDDIYAEVRK